MELLLQFLIGGTALILSVAGCWYYNMKYVEERDKFLGDTGLRL